MNLSQCRTSAWLAWKDWKFEALISLCAVMALASMLAPLLVLQGLKNGITTGMRERLLKDPATLIITPKSDGGSYTKDFIEGLSALPGAAFAIGRIRDSASDLTFRHGQKRVPLALEPAALGEPILARYGATVPAYNSEPQLVLTAPAAQALNVSKDDLIEASLARRTPQGKLESITMEFQVADILPIGAADRKMAFAPHEFLEELENYRDYIEAPKLNQEGRPALQERKYASFRLYATDMDKVEHLAAWLASKNIETITRARDIDAIKSLEDAINQIILIISLAVGAGFTAFMISSSEGAIRRKKKMLGLLRLFGFSRLALVCYPMVQTFLVSICGFFTSLLLYYAVAGAIAEAFAQKGGIVCVLTPLEGATALGSILAISCAASAKAAIQAANLEPSIVVRNLA